jgi:hypothetical protein
MKKIVPVSFLAVVMLSGCVPIYPITTLAYTLDAAQAHKYRNSLSNLVWSPDGNSIYFVRCGHPYTTKVRKADPGLESVFTPFGTDTIADPSRPAVYEIIEITFKERRKSIVSTSHTLKKWKAMEGPWSQAFKRGRAVLQMDYNNDTLGVVEKSASGGLVYPAASQNGFKGQMGAQDTFVVSGPDGKPKYIIDIHKTGVPRSFSLSPDRTRIALFVDENIYLVRTKGLNALHQ